MQRLNSLRLEHIRPQVKLLRSRSILLVSFLWLEQLHFRKYCRVKPEFLVKLKDLRKFHWICMLIVQWIIVVVSNWKIGILCRLNQFLRYLKVNWLTIEQVKSWKTFVRIAYRCLNVLPLQLLWYWFDEMIYFRLFPLTPFSLFYFSDVFQKWVRFHTIILVFFPIWFVLSWHFLLS